MHRKSTSRDVVQLCFAAATALFCLCAQAVSQQKVEAGATLHVYTNLLQIPVLILSQKHQSLPPIAADKFVLRLGTDPPFHPRVRPEGEDPITLAVLIDGAFSGPRLPQLSESLAAMARDQLRPQDRIAFYGLDGCKLRRTLMLRPPDAETAGAAAKALEDIPPFQHHWHGEKCLMPIPLWDALGWVAQSLQSEPGRRVVLVITNGEDEGSKLSPDEARLVATRNGVAVFSLAERFKVRNGSLSTHAIILGASTLSALAYITEGTGGMVMETARNNVAGTLARFPQMLRERYILEFSRPAGMTAGEHSLVVTVGQPKDFIRPAGTSMPVADPEASDPRIEHGKLGDMHDVPNAAQEKEAPESVRSQPGESEPGKSEPVVLPPPVASTQTAAPPRKAPADPTDITDEVQPEAANPPRL